MEIVTHPWREPRSTVDAIVSLLDTGGELMLRARDLSLSGVFVSSALPITLPVKVGQRVTFELIGGDLALPLSGVVARVAPPASGQSGGAGIRFTELDDELRAALTKLIGETRKTDRQNSSGSIP